jgi:hypothetical protein
MSSHISSCAKAWPWRFFPAGFVICGFVLGEDYGENVTTRTPIFLNGGIACPVRENPVNAQDTLC